MLNRLTGTTGAAFARLTAQEAFMYTNTAASNATNGQEPLALRGKLPPSIGVTRLPANVPDERVKADETPTPPVPDKGAPKSIEVSG